MLTPIIKLGKFTLFNLACRQKHNSRAILQVLGRVVTSNIYVDYGPEIASHGAGSAGRRAGKAAVGTRGSGRGSLFSDRGAGFSSHGAIFRSRRWICLVELKGRQEEEKEVVTSHLQTK